MDRSGRLFVVAAFAAVMVGGALLWAGPLDPPPGPVTPTYKTLSQVEPRTPISGLTSGSVNGSPCEYLISQSGSYFLDRNLVWSGYTVEIGVAASNVTIDLNGFTVDGAFGGQVAIRAVSNPTSNIVIRNGTIRNFTQTAVDLTNSAFAVVEDVNVSAPSNNVGVQCLALFNNARLTRCTVQQGNAGIVVGARSKIDACTVIGSSFGVTTGANSKLTQVSVENVGYSGITLGASSSATDCHTTGTGYSGFVLANFCRLDDCTADGTGAASIPGIDSGSASNAILRDCRVSGFQGSAYLLGPSCTATGCAASNCEGSGFVASGGSAVIDACTVHGVAGNGIELSNYCIVTNSEVFNIGSNYRAGAAATSGVVVSGGTRNRVEGNRFRLCPSPITFTTYTDRNECYRNTALSCGSYVNQSIYSNQIGAIVTSAVPSGPWDNTIIY